MNLEEKIKSMSADEIIMAMVNGLRKEWVKVDMNVFGANRKGICFGCAATNAICEIYGKQIPAQYINRIAEHAKFIRVKVGFLQTFEHAIEYLRHGWIDLYNGQVLQIDVAEIKPPNFRLPHLETGDYLEGLGAYERLAEFQKEN